jgi:SAM-dependent methyltransferase
MNDSVYDEHLVFYVDFVDKGLAADDGHLEVLMSVFVKILGERLVGARVLDLACGEGYLGRYLARAGARAIIGVDLSAGLIKEATRRADSPDLAYQVDDAQELLSVPDASVDVVVSQLAFMDIADHLRTFRAVRSSTDRFGRLRLLDPSPVLRRQPVPLARRAEVRPGRERCTHRSHRAPVRK